MASGAWALDGNLVLQGGQGEGLEWRKLGRPSSPPGAGCRWYKDGALLTPSSKYRTLSEPRSGLLVLEILAASKDDLGHYECEVRWADTGAYLGSLHHPGSLMREGILDPLSPRVPEPS